jgi:hypothetical protein
MELLAALTGFAASGHDLAKIRDARLGLKMKFAREVHLQGKPGALLKPLGKFFQEGWGEWRRAKRHKELLKAGEDVRQGENPKKCGENPKGCVAALG